jgi:hypothetical protein
MSTHRTATTPAAGSGPRARGRAARRRVVPAILLGLLLAACGSDGPVEVAASQEGTCLSGDEACLDELGDAAASEAIPLVTGAADDADLLVAAAGSTDGAFAHRVQAASVDGTTLTLAFDALACEAVEDVLVMERDDAVEVVVLAGPSADGPCPEDAPVARRAVQVELVSPLDGRDLVQTP